MPIYLVETYLSKGDTGGVASIAARVQAAAGRLNDEGIPIHYLRSFLIPEDETLFSIFEAHSPEAVHETSVRAGLSVNRLMETLSD